jgi:hypothetical protein
MTTTSWYEWTRNVLGIDLVCPIERYEHTPDDRLELMYFYESAIGQAIYNWRSISVEPLIEHIKSVFRIDPLPVRGYQNAAAIVLLSALLYQIVVYYNCKTGNANPKSIKVHDRKLLIRDSRDRRQCYRIMPSLK